MSVMKRLRRTLSFRSRSKYAARRDPQNWENDGINIKHGGLNFNVKYLGCLEVTESRGTQVCSQAAHHLKMSSDWKKKKVTIWITEDTIRVIDDNTKSLIVDQVIEKVSFCTPDPHDEKLFSYICRDGTTRRWMCHSFRGIKDTGERISHAVGCAFAACLQKKQQQNLLNQSFQRQASGRKSQLSGKRENGVVLPKESVEQLQQLNKQEYEQKVKEVEQKNTSAGPSSPARQESPLIPDAPAPAPAPASAPSASAKSANTYVRPRPTPNNPDFTRHLSLRYRNNPMSMGPLAPTSGSSTYEALTDDIPAPRLPPMSLSDDSSSFDPATFKKEMTAPFNNQSQADMWLASATGSQAAAKTNQGLLTTTVPNPFTTSATTVGGSSWSHSFNQQPVSSPGTGETPNPFGGGDTFQRQWSGQTSPSPAQVNPFGGNLANGRHEQFV